MSADSSGPSSSGRRVATRAGTSADRGYKRSWKNLLINKQYQLRFTLFMVALSAVLMTGLGLWVMRLVNTTTTVGISRIIGATAGAAADVRRAIVPESTWKRRKGKALSHTESDQTARLARVTAFALDTWNGNLDAVREFLAAPHPELDNESPVHAMQTDSGARLVEDILKRLRHGLPA